MNARRLIKIIPLVMITLMSFTNYMESWYVATTGDNSNDCRAAATPCKTIQAAINKAGNVDYIFIAAGTYSASTNGETFPINITKSLDISGIDAASTIIDASGSGPNVFHANGCSLVIDISHITIQGGNRGIELIGDNDNCITGQIALNNLIFNSTGIYVKGTYNEINGNYISNNNEFGIYCFDTFCRIKGNLMAFNGNGIGSSAAIYNEDSHGWIGNNVIYWNNGSGVYNDNSNPVIINNTIAANYGGSGTADWNYSDSHIANNIIVSNGVYGIFQDETCTTGNMWNDVWGNNPYFGNYYGTVAGRFSISADPLFVSAIDAHLRCSSPAIDEGNSLDPWVPQFDFDNNPRPVGEAVDMGAFEKQSNLFCPPNYLPFITR